MSRTLKLKYLILFPFLSLLFLIAVSSVGAERPFPKPEGLVNDFAKVISPGYKEKIQAVTGALLQKTGIPIVVVTMPDIGGAEYNDYANRLYSAWGIGKKGEDKGVLIFVAVKERKVRIETGYGVEGILPDGLVGEIRDRYMIPYLKARQVRRGIVGGRYSCGPGDCKELGNRTAHAGSKEYRQQKERAFRSFPSLLY